MQPVMHTHYAAGPSACMHLQGMLSSHCKGHLQQDLLTSDPRSLQKNIIMLHCKTSLTQSESSRKGRLPRHHHPRPSFSSLLAPSSACCSRGPPPPAQQHIKTFLMRTGGQAL